MMSVGLLFSCVISVIVYRARTTEDDLPLFSFDQWRGMVNSTKFNQGSEPGSNYVCYEWKSIFGTRRDVALETSFSIPPDMLLQVYKYSGNTEEFIGEATNCFPSSVFAIAIANCTGFSVRFVDETCEESKLSSTVVTTFYYSTKMVSESRLDDCQRSSCGNASCFSLSNIHTMGYRCYCKKWSRESCVPAFQDATNMVTACKCPPKNFLGEICYLGGHHNVTQLDSPKTFLPSNASPDLSSVNKMRATASPSVISRSVSVLATTSPPVTSRPNSDDKKNVGIIAGAGTLSCFVVILLVLAVYFFYRRKRLNAVEGENECDTMEIEPDEQKETRRVVDYEVVSAPPPLPDVLTTNPGYGKTSVVDNPAYNVAIIANQSDQQ